MTETLIAVLAGFALTIVSVWFGFHMGKRQR